MRYGKTLIITLALINKHGAMTPSQAFDKWPDDTKMAVIRTAFTKLQRMRLAHDIQEQPKKRNSLKLELTDYGKQVAKQFNGYIESINEKTPSGMIAMNIRNKVPNSVFNLSEWGT